MLVPPVGMKLALIHLVYVVVMLEIDLLGYV